MFMFKVVIYMDVLGLPSSSVGKESYCKAGDWEFDPLVNKIPGGGHSHSSILGWSIHEQRNSAGYSPWSHKVGP